ncbi:cyclopropane-fatty-acyl-phospholipid synthase family protein [Nocardioides terrisoli]|uniref:cyclopropane-fatty-acyl-phospholipid synthase family protein n=1 Tax=Nocardioides terrisoli TaxID=3388267 RepID=UPI00287B7810|nr:cyclopropane-fatty-acyl-phospholipid synthase family protein [Nocardioides marmorisolisilvae]
MSSSTLEVTTRHPVSRQAWAGLGDVPSGARARLAGPVARLLVERTARRLGVTVGPEPAADLVLHRPDEFYARLGTDGLIGFGEGYLTGAWDAADLTGTLTTLCSSIDSLVPAWMQRMRAAYVARPPRTEHNSINHARDNIARHYDLSNALFRTFLDSTMSYSAALFDAAVHDRGDHLLAGAPNTDEPFEDAQARKIERILDQARVGPGSRVLEIGTGWGELAVRAAARGARVRTVTLSSSQQNTARRRVLAAGYADVVDVDLADYRTVTGSYDAIVSVEMIEAVGHEFWATYFKKIDDLLAPGGSVAIQAITMPHQRMLATRNTWTWINKYIFPGGFLPSVQAIEEVTRTHTTLQVTDRLSFGGHYAETLRRWDEAFLAAEERVADLGFDDVFRRMWHFYLCYSRAGFASGYLDVQQLTLSREGR